MMDNLETINQDRTCGKPSEEPDGTVDHPTCQKLDVDSIYECNPSSTNSFDVDPSTKEEIMATGYPSRENIFVGHGFVGSFYPKYGVANWVFECLTLNQINVINKHKMKYPRGEFYADRKIDFERIVTSMDYENSGYDKGHLAAAANHKYNSLAYYSTFWYGNTAPMHKGVNNILNKIEEHGRKLATKYKRLDIITGSVFKRKIKLMKVGSQVRVPDAYFKVFICHGSNVHKMHKKYKVCGYMVDNKSDNNEKLKRISKNIELARKSLSSINNLTGLNILNVEEVDEEPLPNWRNSRRMLGGPISDRRTPRRGSGS